MEQAQSLRKKLWSLSYPTMLSFALQAIYDMIDMVWVGKISSKAVAGVTIFTTIFWIFDVLNEIIGSSSVSMISQSYGRGDRKRTLEIAEQTISFKILMSLLTMVLLLVFLQPLLSLYTKDPEVIQAAKDYGYLRIYFLPVFFASFSVNTIFRCQGDAKTPMYIMGLSTLVNLVLDPIFMFETIPFLGLKGFGLGVYGAALATVISICLSFLLGFFLLLKGHNGIYIRWKGLFRLIPSIDKKLLKIGIPNGLQQMLRFIFNALVVHFVADYGVDAISAFGIAGKIYSTAFLPLNGLMMGGSTLVGHYLGQEDVATAKRVTRLAARMNAGIMGGFLLTVLVFRHGIMGLFIQDANVKVIGAQMMLFSSFFLPFLGYGFGCGVAFMGSGHNKPLLYSGLLADWCIQLPLLYGIVRIFHLPISYLFASYMPADFICFLLLFLAYKKGGWTKRRV